MILITGASQGLGEALALVYAGPGVTLGLLGRDSARLEKVAGECRSRGAVVETSSLDVLRVDALMDWVSDFDNRYSVDLVIANAGVASTLGGVEVIETWDTISNVFDTNLRGALATIHPLLGRMQSRGHGQIGLMSSVGAYAGMPISPAYNASKAAVKVYGEGLRGNLATAGVGVTVICPGFMRSAMSDAYPGPRPFMVDTQRAAAIIKRGLACNEACVAFPLPIVITMRLLALLPTDIGLLLQRVFRF